MKGVTNLTRKWSTELNLNETTQPTIKELQDQDHQEMLQRLAPQQRVIYEEVKERNKELAEKIQKDLKEFSKGMKLLEENQIPECVVVHEDPEDLERIRSYADQAMGPEAYRSRTPTSGNHLPKTEQRENFREPLRNRRTEQPPQFSESYFREPGGPQTQRQLEDEDRMYYSRRETWDNDYQSRRPPRSISWGYDSFAEDWEEGSRTPIDTSFNALGSEITQELRGLKDAILHSRKIESGNRLREKLKSQAEARLPTLSGTPEDRVSPERFFDLIEEIEEDEENQLLLVALKLRGVAEDIYENLRASGEFIKYRDVKDRLLKYLAPRETVLTASEKFRAIRRKPGETLLGFAMRIEKTANSLKEYLGFTTQGLTAHMVGLFQQSLPEAIITVIDIQHPGCDFSQYWQAAVELINKTPSHQLRDEDVRKESTEHPGRTGMLTHPARMVPETEAYGRDRLNPVENPRYGYGDDFGTRRNDYRENNNRHGRYSLENPPFNNRYRQEEKRGNPQFGNRPGILRNWNDPRTWNKRSTGPRVWSGQCDQVSYPRSWDHDREGPTNNWREQLDSEEPSPRNQWGGSRDEFSESRREEEWEQNPYRSSNRYGMSQNWETNYNPESGHRNNYPEQEEYNYRDSLSPEKRSEYEFDRTETEGVPRRMEEKTPLWEEPRETFRQEEPLSRPCSEVVPEQNGPITPDIKRPQLDLPKGSDATNETPQEPSIPTVVCNYCGPEGYDEDEYRTEHPNLSPYRTFGTPSRGREPVTTQQDFRTVAAEPMDA